MTSQVIYKHSAAADAINMQTNDLQVSHKYENKGVDYKDGKVYKVYDANRVGRVFKFGTLLSRVDFGKLEGYLRPASVPNYSGTTYPRFTSVYYGDATKWDNVEVVITSFSGSMSGRDESDVTWMCTITAEEKND